MNIYVFLDFVEDNNAECFLKLKTNSIIEVRDTKFFEDKFNKNKNISLLDISENLKKVEASPFVLKELVLAAEETNKEVEELHLSARGKQNYLEIILSCIMWKEIY